MQKVLYFMAGGIFGGALGYIFARKTLDKKYEQMLNVEIGELQVYYKEKVSGESSVSAQKEEITLKKEEEITEDDYFTPLPKGKRTNYSSYFKDPDIEFDTNLAADGLPDPGGPTEDDEEDDDIYEEVSDEDEIVVKHMSKLGIELISSIDYNERNGYEKDEIYYYKKTKTVADNNDELFEDWEDILGTEWIDVVEQNGAMTIYVRNNGFAKDFLITCLNERYDFSRL